MQKATKRTSVLVALLFAALCVLSGVSLLWGAQTNAYADEASVIARNENLVVRYDMGAIEGGKIKASKWENGKYVPYTEMDATITDGTVQKSAGNEGEGAAIFGAKAYAKTDRALQLGTGATGATVTAWVKNLEKDWGALIELFGGEQGGRFGRGTIGYNDGKYGDWNWDHRTYPDAGATFANGGAWNSFVTSSDAKGTDTCDKDRWYFVAITLTSDNITHYRNAQSKIVYPNAGDTKAGTIVRNIWAGFSSGNSKIALRPGQVEGNDLTATNEEIDDFRIYKGAMTQAEITAVYNEYKALAELSKKTIKTDDANFGNVEVAVSASAEIVVTDKTAAFPKLLIGGATAADVTESDGTYSYTGADLSYRYTVEGDVASVRLLDAAADAFLDFTVTRTALPAYLTDLKVSIDGGEAQTIDGFILNKQDYSLNLTPNNYSVAFSGTAGAGTVDFAAVNGNINYNGANVITVTSSDSNSYSYTVTISRERSDVLPIVCGKTIAKATQTIYLDEVPASVTESDIELTYPGGATLSGLSYASGVVTFTLTDKAVSANTTTYTVTIKSSKDAQLAYWTLDETSGTSYAGYTWNKTEQAFEKNNEYAMTTYVGGNGVAPTTGRTPTAPTSVDGKLGTGIELANWGYTAAKLPTASDATGFTFSTWMKTSGIVWEAIFAVYNRAYTEGVIFEKGHMQWPKFENGNTSGSYGGNYDPAQAVWKEGLNSEDARKNYFNSSSDFVLYTVTVSYVNNVGVVKFYKNGELAATYDNVADGNTVAKRTIGALNNGGYIGLHRHIYDGGQKSTFDDVRLFSYAMTDEEVSAYHAAYESVVGFAPAPIAVEGLTGYPEVKFSSTDTVTVEGGKGIGLMADGMAYSYTVPTASPVSKATDKVTVSLYKNFISRDVEVLFNRTFDAPVAATLGYKIGAGDNQSLTVKASQTVPVSSEVDLTQADAIVKGDCSVVVASGADESVYTIAFAYNAATRTATYTVQYNDYTENVTVYTVKFENAMGSNQFMVTFDSQGGSAVNSVAVTNGEKVQKPTDPTRNGYTFGGWYKDRACTEAWNFETEIVNGPTILYAKWTPVSTTPVLYEVKFETNGGSAVASQTVQSGGKVQKPSNPAKSGYTFGGWYKDEACTQAWDFENDTVTGTLTLYAKWTEGAPATNEPTKKGCGSSVTAEVSVVLAALLLALAGVVVLKKKTAKN